MIVSRLDAPPLRKGLSRMKPSALGLDGWSLADLRSLPHRLLGWLSDLLREARLWRSWQGGSQRPQGGPIPYATQWRPPGAHPPTAGRPWTGA